MKRVLFFLIISIHCTSHLFPQITLDDYRVVPMAMSLDTLSGETAEILGPDVFWELSGVIDLPFDFYYLDQAFSQIKVSSAGFITFDVSTTSHYSYSELDDIYPKNVLAPFWDNLSVSSNGKVHCKVTGESPDRAFTVEFYHMVWGLFDTPVIDFQVILFEGSNDIEFHYGNMDEPGFSASGASIGIKDDQGNFINALDGSRDIPQSEILKPPRRNYRFTYSPPPPQDIGISELLLAPDWFVGNADTVEVAIKNYGSQEQSGFIVKYQIAGEDPVQELFDGVLQPDSVIIYTFNALWEPASPGYHQICAWTELDGDANLYNDSLLVEDAVTVYEIELPPPTDIQGDIDEQNRIEIGWKPGEYHQALPGEWNGITSEDQNVHMLVNYNGSEVDSCEIYFTVYGDPFPFPLRTYSKRPIVNNEFSFYYTDEYGKMSIDVTGTFIPPDSCTGTWRSGVYVNNVYTVFSGTWEASAEIDAPVLLGYQVYRSDSPDSEPIESNLLAETGPEVTACTDTSAIENITYYYLVVALYNYGTSVQSQEVSVLKVGMEPSPVGRIRMYPNPTNNLLTIETTEAARYMIELTSLNGQMIACMEMQGTTRQIDLSYLQKGVYIITIRWSKDFVTTRKIVKL